MKEEDVKKCERELANMLVCTFGYWEVEDEILQRCIEAIKAKNMEPLKKNLCVFCSGDFSLYQMHVGKVALKLWKNGIWQYVKQKIEQAKKENE